MDLLLGIRGRKFGKYLLCAYFGPYEKRDLRAFKNTEKTDQTMQQSLMHNILE